MTALSGITNNSKSIREYYTPKQIERFLNRNKLSKKTKNRWKWNILIMLYAGGALMALFTAVETISAPSISQDYSKAENIAKLDLLPEEVKKDTSKPKTLAVATKKQPIRKNRITQSDIQNQVQAIASEYGWGEGSQWEALAWIIQKESSWNPNAQNKKSTAYGLFQFLDQTWIGYKCQKNADIANQTKCGLKYIQARYRTPVEAKAHHLRKGWY